MLAAAASLSWGAASYVLLQAARAWARLPRRQAPGLPPAVVLIRLDAIGDVLLTSPMLAPLREGFPEHRIVVLTRSSCVPLLATSPRVDEVIVLRVAGHRASLRVQLGNAAVVRRLRRRYRIDVLLHPRWDADYYGVPLLVAVAGPRVAAGYARDVSPMKFALNPGSDLVLDEIVQGPPVAHEVERNIDVLRAVGCHVADPVTMELTLTEEDRDRAARLPIDTAEGPVVALGVGAGNPKRTWPPHHFEELVVRLRASLNATFVVIGGPEDAPVGKELESRFGGSVHDLCGKLSLRETAAVLERTALYVGADSGPAHMAAVVSVPSVIVSCHPAGGSAAHENAPERFHPWGVHHVVVRPPRPTAPCVDCCAANQPHCILQVAVDDVVRATEDLLVSRS